MFLTARHQSVRSAYYHFIVFLGMVAVTLAFWSYHHTMRQNWHGVPSVPSYKGVIAGYLGDQQLAYRWVSLKIQNFGDTGGETVPIKTFDYDLLKKWLFLATKLDHTSNYIPSLAAYYYGGVNDKERLHYIVNYLSDIGQTVDNGKWRWLAQAVFLARFKLEDQDLALDLAYRLAALEGGDLPVWTDQMPAFVLAKTGEEKAALDIMTTIMATDTTLEQNEINYMCWYVTDKIKPSKTLLLNNEIYQGLCAGRQF